MKHANEPARGSRVAIRFRELAPGQIAALAPAGVAGREPGETICRRRREAGTAGTIHTSRALLKD